MLSKTYITNTVKQALQEDIGTGDLTATLIPVDKQLRARIMTREDAVICGRAFAEEAFLQVNPKAKITWFCEDAQKINTNEVLLEVAGQARALLTAERTALNFLQFLSGTATLTHRFVEKIAHTHCQLLDTRKTIPGLRLAQKYAVHCGGGHNHRIGLFDAFLIKENHIAACGSITAALKQAKREAKGQLIEIEVENLEQLEEAIGAGASRIMLDNFKLPQIQEAVKITAKRVPLEVSGNVTVDTIATIAETGVDFISVGSVTKHVRAIDLSMRVIEDA